MDHGAVEAVPLDQRAAEIAYRVFNAPRAGWPFPHALIDEVLPRDLFAALRSLELDGDAFQARPTQTGIAAAENHRHVISVSPDDVDTNADLPPLIRYA